MYYENKGGGTIHGWHEDLSYQTRLEYENNKRNKRKKVNKSIKYWINSILKICNK